MRRLALFAAVGVMLLASPALAVNVTQYSLVQQGNTVTQTFLISRPTLIPLSFSYCNGQSCGNPQDPDLACYVNLYNPTFAENFPGTVTIGALGQGRPGKVFLKDGNLAGFDLKYGYYDATHPSDWNKSILTTAPTFNADGSVTLSFDQGPIQAFKDFKKSPRGRVCGISAEQLANFKQQYGAAFDNVNQAAMKVSIVWQVDNPQYANPFDQTVTINGQRQPFKPMLTGPTSPNATTELQQTMRTAPPSNPTTGLTSQDLTAALTSYGYQLEPQTDLGQITNRLSQGQPAIAVTTNGAALVTGYNNQRDTFQVTDTSSGKFTNVSYGQFMSSNPSFTFATKATK